MRYIQVINLPIPNPRVEHKSGIVVKLKIETELVALDPKQDLCYKQVKKQKGAKTDALGTCSTASSIYVTGNHSWCVFELLKGDKKGSEGSCQIELLTDAMLLQAISLSDWISVRLELTEVCEEAISRNIKLILSLAMI